MQTEIKEQVSADHAGILEDSEIERATAALLQPAKQKQISTIQELTQLTEYDFTIIDAAFKQPGQVDIATARAAPQQSPLQEATQLDLH